jgi:hypothetical protein
MLRNAGLRGSFVTQSRSPDVRGAINNDHEVSQMCPGRVCGEHCGEVVAVTLTGTSASDLP